MKMLLIITSLCLLSVSRLSFAALLFNSGAPIPLSAEPGYPILGQGIAGTIPGSTTTTGGGIGAKFDVGGLGWNLANIELSLFGPAAMGMGSNPQDIHLGIANDAGEGLPSAGFMSIAAELNLSGVDNEGLYSVPASDLLLTPGSYWLVVLPASPSLTDFTSVGWNQTASPGLGTMACTGDYGLSWSGNEVQPMSAFSLYGTEVPEPATMVLLGLGGFLLRRRKRA